MSAPLPPPDTLPKPDAPWREFARAPLVPVALAATVGLIADRYISMPFEAEWAAAVIALVGWYFTPPESRQVALGWLLLCVASLTAAYHHSHRHSFSADNISNFAKETPYAIHVRGKLADEPDRFRPPRYDPLLTLQRDATSTCVLEVTAVDGIEGWRPASGFARLTVEGRLDDLHCGDIVEITGRLTRPDGPHNPGERDYRALLLDRRITAELRVKRSWSSREAGLWPRQAASSNDSVVRLEEGWRASLFGWLAAVRGWGARALQQTLPEESGLATALLLGDSTALEREEWDAYIRTGVIHVLAISGQHLVVLGWFLWLVLRVCGVRRRHGAWVIAIILLAYALMTGARPSAIRAAVMVGVVCGGIILRRPVIPANAFAFAWLIVLAANPTDPFTAGCQLSFLSVFVLIWGCSRWLTPRELTPVEQLIEETRSTTEKILRALLRALWQLFAVSTILTVANAPLVLAWQNVASPIAVILGPPLILLTAIALVAGFLLLIVSPFGAAAAWPFARATDWSLSACEKLVHLGDRVPFGHVYSPAPPMWWLVGFYSLLAALILLEEKWTKRAFVALVVFTIFGLLLSFYPRTTDEARITYLAVGHGTCIVIETPDGRVLLYDTGTTTGPDAVRRVIAPFLWSRGISRIDEVFLSHADLDHFNGLPELLRRFHVGQVTMTPTFSDKQSPGVEAVLAVLEKYSVPRRVVSAGERFSAGNITFDVLHPPAIRPDGNENTRSLVLLMRHEGHTFLLTGDLEGVGQSLTTSRPIAPVDVMLAPHHGAKNANEPKGTSAKPEPGVMAAWARPKLVISSQRTGTPTDHLHASYNAVGATVWDTPTAGAVIVRSHATGVIAEAYMTKEVKVVKRGK